EGIYSFSIGFVNGDYHGARRSDDVIQIMRNDLSTDNQSWYYSVNSELNADQLVVNAGNFDPRTRVWYQEALVNDGPVFSSVYKHFVMEDLSISAAWPLYMDEQLLGVMGCHLLLDDINEQLQDILARYNGHAIIFERESKQLIANSFDQSNFKETNEVLVRSDITDIKQYDFSAVYQAYLNQDENSFINEDKKLIVNVINYQQVGIDWVILSIIPDHYYTSSVYDSVMITIFLIMLIAIITIVVYGYVIDYLFKPLEQLRSAASDFTKGDYQKRVKITRDDEIGSISQSFNSLAAEIEQLIANLEGDVADSSDELKLILNTAAEGIYGIDLNGNCTFCNESAIKLLGYNDQNDLLHKNMHDLIHHHDRNNEPISKTNCLINKAMQENKGIVCDNEVFFKADGTSLLVEYRAYPKTKQEDIVGAVVTFVDISERKQKEAQLAYLNCHDVLTSLKNRRCFENDLKLFDNDKNLPLTIIFGDINGLKLTNDIFGHQTGDNLIKQSAKIIQEASREGDVIARVGGDEFILLLPKTTSEQADEVITKIKNDFAQTQIAAIKCSIALGKNTKEEIKQDIEEVMGEAENAMYRDKTLNRQKVNKDLIYTIIDSLHTNDNNEKEHSIQVRDLAQMMGEALSLSQTELNKLKEAAFLHDIGKITLDKRLLLKKELTPQEYALMQQHPVVGYRILNLFDDMLDLAEYVYYHHEHYDGSGYPIGLKGKQIPLLARIIAIAEVYDRIVNSDKDPSPEIKQAALQVIKDGANTQFDPELARLFYRLMSEE
ncbi:MAG: diguanylate cyclase, partial [Erysipelotrichaceae bacterium]|nr:diguanylate cyclase [Erysipelotrichaceae bacterium]